MKIAKEMKLSLKDKLMKENRNAAGASSADIARIAAGMPIEGAPASPSDISPYTNDPNPDNAQLALMVQDLRCRIDFLEQGKIKG